MSESKNKKDKNSKKRRINITPNKIKRIIKIRKA